MTDGIIYECEICGSYHRWTFRGDCRDNRERFGDVVDYAIQTGVDPLQVEVRSMSGRVAADDRGER